MGQLCGFCLLSPSLCVLIYKTGTVSEMMAVRVLTSYDQGNIIIIAVDVIVVRNGVTLGQPVLLSLRILSPPLWLLSSPKYQECAGSPIRPAVREHDLLSLGKNHMFQTFVVGKLRPEAGRGFAQGHPG